MPRRRTAVRLYEPEGRCFLSFLYPHTEGIASKIRRLIFAERRPQIKVMLEGPGDARPCVSTSQKAGVSSRSCTAPDSYIQITSAVGWLNQRKNDPFLETQDEYLIFIPHYTLLHYTLIYCITFNYSIIDYK